ncbi:MAG TPA: phosphoenolpyruvate hydrolase family protein [Arthrobacter sp.]|nr:phosphoenolpyruvate hydrolase family protein [Arthrobacter sp.]
MRYPRSEVVHRLNRQVAGGHAIIAAGAGTGISAKFVEAGGGDLVIVYNSGRFRMAGHSSMAGLLAFGDANAIVYEMGTREVLPAVREVPVIAGVNGTDPTRDMQRLLVDLSDAGFSGINNFPTIGLFDGNVRLDFEATGLGFDKEVEMIRLAHSLDLFTIVYVFNPVEARDMAAAGADVVIAHMGVTVGGSTGVSRGQAADLSTIPDRVDAIGKAAIKENPEILLLCHGGPIATVPDAEYVLSNSSAVGFVGASSMERLPVEEAIAQTTRKFKEIPLLGPSSPRK